MNRLVARLSLRNRYRILREVVIWLGLFEYLGLGGGFMFLGREDYLQSGGFFALLAVSSYISAKLSWVASEMLIRLATEKK